jgi:hypothetical protein
MGTECSWIGGISFNDLQHSRITMDENNELNISY